MEEGGGVEERDRKDTGRETGEEMKKNGMGMWLLILGDLVFKTRLYSF